MMLCPRSRSHLGSHVVTQNNLSEFDQTLQKGKTLFSLSVKFDQICFSCFENDYDGMSCTRFML